MNSTATSGIASSVRRDSLWAPAAVGALALVLWLGPATPQWAIDWPFTGRDPGLEDFDILLYYQYADQIAGGSLPYRDFQFEYPPLSALWIGIPRAFFSEAPAYRDAYIALTGATAVAAAVVTLLAARAAGLDRRTQIAAGGLVAVGPTLLGHSFSATRLDLLPTLLVAAAALAAARDRDAPAGALAGLGAAAKLWPAVMLVPLVALAFIRGGRLRARRVAIGFALAVGIPFGVAAIVSLSGLVDSLSFQADRPLHIESVGATVLLALDQIGIGGAYASEGGFGSLNLAGGAADVLADTSNLTALVAVIAITTLGAVRIAETTDRLAGFETAMRVTLAAIVALIVFGKVLSPQYMLWLLPLPLLVGGRSRWAAGALVAIALVLTNLASFEHDPYAFEREVGPTLLFLFRDLALVALLAVLVVPLVRRAAPRARRALHSSATM